MKKYKIYSYPEGWEDVLDSEKDAELIDEVRRSFQRASEEIKANPPTAETLEAIRRHFGKKVFLRRKNNDIRFKYHSQS
jgi:hypothetical protein